jgi:hypothetical protein
MGIENSAGLGVNNTYGPRKTAEGRSGEVKTAGVVKEVQLDFRGDNYSIVSATLPKGAKFIEAVAYVEEAFVLGGSSPTINVGTSGSAGTNYAIELSEAQAEAAGTVVYNSTGAGTFNSALAAETPLKVELDGTSPTSSDAGKAKIVVRYIVAINA